MSAPLDFEAFCHEVYLPLVRTLTLYCGDPDLARDLAQESMIKVSSRWRSVSRMDNPRGWTWRVAINLTNSHYRRRRIEQRSNRTYQAWENDAVTDPDPSEALLVRAVLQTLPPRQRAALVLRYYEDLPVAATADAMGCSEGTVKKLAARGLSAMRSAIEDELAVEVRDAS